MHPETKKLTQKTRPI